MVSPGCVSELYPSIRTITAVHATCPAIVEPQREHMAFPDEHWDQARDSRRWREIAESLSLAYRAVTRYAVAVGACGQAPRSSCRSLRTEGVARGLG